MADASAARWCVVVVSPVRVTVTKAPDGSFSGDGGAVSSSGGAAVVEAAPS